MLSNFSICAAKGALWSYIPSQGALTLSREARREGQVCKPWRLKQILAEEEPASSPLVCVLPCVPRSHTCPRSVNPLFHSLQRKIQRRLSGSSESSVKIHYHFLQIFLSPLESMLTLKGIFSASSDPSHSPSCIWTPWWLSAQWHPAGSTFESSPEGRETAPGPPRRRGLNRDTRSTHRCLGYLQRRSATCRNKMKSVMSGQAS